MSRRSLSITALVMVAAVPWVAAIFHPGDAVPASWQAAQAALEQGDGEAAARAFRAPLDPSSPRMNAMGRLNAARAEGAAAQGYLEEGADWLLLPALQCLDRARADLAPLLSGGPWDVQEVRQTWARLGELQAAMEARLRASQTADALQRDSDAEGGGREGPSSASGDGSGAEGGRPTRIVGVVVPAGAGRVPLAWGTPLGAADRQRVRKVLEEILEERRRRLVTQPLPLGPGGGSAW